MAVLIMKRQQAAPIGAPIRCQIEDIGVKAVLARYRIIMGRQEVASPKPRRLSIGKGRAGIAGQLANEVQERWTVEHLVGRT